MSDQASPAQSQLQTQLGQLGGFTRTGLTGDYHNLMITQCGENIFAPLHHRQLGWIIETKRLSTPPLGYRDRAFKLTPHTRQATVNRLAFTQTPLKSL